MKEKCKRIFARCWARKRRIFGILIILIIVGVWFGKKHFKSETDTSFVSNDYTVISGEVANSLNLAGTTQFANAQKLTFVNKGRVTSVKTKIGAHVKKGEVLASITTDDLDRDVEKAKKDLKNKQLDLQNLLKKSNRQLDLLKAQSSYDLLVLQKQTLPSEQLLELQDTERQIREDEKILKEAETDYAELLSGKAGASNAELALSENIRKRNKDMEDLVNGFRIKANELEAVLNDYDLLVKLSDKYTANDQNIYLGAKNVSAMNQSKNTFWTMKSYIPKLNNLYQEFSKIPVGQLTENQILSGYSLFKELGTEMKSRGKINALAFGDSISTNELTQDVILGYITKYGTEYENKGFAYINEYSSAVEKLAGLKKSDTTVEDAKNKVEKLTIELQKKKLKAEILKKQQTLSLAEKDKEIQDAKVDLEKAKSGNLQQEQIDQIKNEIDNLQFNLTTLMKKYDEYKIIANFDGVVTKLNMQVGDSIDTSTSTENQKFIYVETPNLLEVKLEVDQIDIVKIQMGMPVEIFLDTFPGKVYSGSFSEIDTMPEGNNYKAKVVFQKHSPDEKILGGMSASVKVVLNKAENAIIVPNPALADNEEGKKIVRLKKGNERVDQIVEVGIADDTNTVILSGLQLGDEIKGLYINETSIKNAGINEKSESGKSDFGGMQGGEATTEVAM